MYMHVSVFVISVMLGYSCEFFKTEYLNMWYTKAFFFLYKIIYILIIVKVMGKIQTEWCKNDIKDIKKNVIFYFKNK